jgi:CRISPR-associated protein Cst1
MDSVTRPMVRLTGHPIQRTGAWAVAVLAGRAHPERITREDLIWVRDQIVTDVQRAARATDQDSIYSWWKVLFALYPNSPATHAQRRKWPDLDDRIAALLTEGEETTDRCVFCDASASARWAKDLLPMFDTAKARNILPPGSGGWPVCWACRVTSWAVPYGAAVTLGSATVITAGAERIERQFVRRNVQRAKQLISTGTMERFRASPERVVVRILRTFDLRAPVTLWTFKNDNQEPWLKVQESRSRLAGFLNSLSRDQDAVQGWGTMCRLLTRRDRSGAVTELGVDRVARALFEPSGRPYPTLLKEIFQLVEGRLNHLTPRAYQALVALARHYAEEMLEMNLTELEPAAELLARWIAAGNPRGRFNEYVKAARRPGALGVLLMQAEARLLLDSGPDDPPLTMRAADAQRVLAAGSEGAHRRMLLFFCVVDKLSTRGVVLGTGKPSEDVEEQPIEESLRTGEDSEYEEND